jgi:hypothetical protein
VTENSFHDERERKLRELFRNPAAAAIAQTGTYLKEGGIVSGREWNCESEKI